MTRAEYAVAQSLAIATAVAAEECERLEGFAVFVEDGACLAAAAELREKRVQAVRV